MGTREFVSLIFQDEGEEVGPVGGVRVGECSLSGLLTSQLSPELGDLLEENLGQVADLVLESGL